MKILLLMGHCSAEEILRWLVSEPVSIIVRKVKEDELPCDFHDIEIVETHLTAEEYKRIWKCTRKTNYRIHACLCHPLSLVICRKVLKEYRKNAPHER